MRHYQDFIEGIKPVANDDSSICYKVLPGMFKKMCVSATYSAYARSANSGFTRDMLFDLAIEQLWEEIGRSLDNNTPYELKSKENYPIHVIELTERGSLVIKHMNNITETKHNVLRRNLLVLFLTYNSMAEIQKVGNIKDVIGGCDASAYWAVLNKVFDISSKIDHTATQQSNMQPTDYDNMATAVAGFDWSVLDCDKIDSLDPYVFIIDEINRGNVSQIFGELITLIEPDKRAGMPEALEVTLPYSKEKFSVPPNLYILGTMNTADRSVEALDTALRRRFTFKEFLPLEEVRDDQNNDLMAKPLCDYSMKEIMTVINNRIRILLDRDHQIGHSYFLGLTTDEELMTVFNQKIIPLLQEYFYGDYAKIGLVLGSGFVEKDSLNINDLSDFAYDDKDSLVKDNYKITTHESVEEFKKAIRLMISGENG